MTGIERLRELAGGIERDARMLFITTHAYDAEHDNVSDTRIRQLLYDIADQIERERAEDAEAIAWVREHGGLERVKGLLDWVVGHCSTRQQLDFDFWLSGRVMYELGFEDDMADRNEVERRLLARLMPEGMEWLVEAWPRFEDGEPVRFEDEWCLRTGGTTKVGQVVLVTDWSFALNASWYEPGERVKRPAKLLDADGAEIELSDDLYSVEGGLKFHVSYIDRINGKIATDAMFSLDKWADPAMYTHRAPVLAADGRPLREGETVWDTKGNGPYIIDGLEGDGVVRIKGNDFDYFGSEFVHERPDSYDAPWEDIENCAVGYEGFMRRAKALAERDA